MALNTRIQNFQNHLKREISTISRNPASSNVQVIENILEAFDNWTFSYRDAGIKPNRNLERIALRRIREACFLSPIRDEELIYCVLIKDYGNDEGFTDLCHSFLTLLENVKDDNIMLRQLEFMMIVANKKRLEFNDSRFADAFMRYGLMNNRAIELPAVFFKPKVFLLLLQHGANPYNDRRVWLTQILWHYKFKFLWTTTARFQSLSFSEIKAAYTSLEYILRSFQKMPFSSSWYLREETSRESKWFYCGYTYIDHLEESTRMLERIKKRYSEPTTLKHICKCVIRQTLNDEWMLPTGIFELPLPNRLKSYLNIEFD